MFNQIRITKNKKSRILNLARTHLFSDTTLLALAAENLIDSENWTPITMQPNLRTTFTHEALVREFGNKVIMSSNPGSGSIVSDLVETERVIAELY